MDTLSLSELLHSQRLGVEATLTGGQAEVDTGVFKNQGEKEEEPA